MDTHTELDAPSRVAPRESFVGLRKQHQRDVEGYRERLSWVASSREYFSLIRREIARQALKRRAPRA